MRPEQPIRRVGAPLARFALSALLALGLSACASLSGIEPQSTLRDARSLGLPPAQGEAPQPDRQWWREFGDVQLNRLMDQALASNPSLGLVQARMARAQAGMEVTAATRAPQVNVALDATRQRYTANGAVPPPLAGAVRDSGTAQLAGSWELDFFGKNRAALEAALGQARAAQADVEAARMLLASRVARAYFQLARLNEQLGVARRQLAQREQALRLVRERVNAGLDTRLELLQGEGALPEARLQIEMLQEQLSLARNALNALLGQPAQAMEIPALSAIKGVASTSVMPSDLLGRRADIAAARWRVQAATEELGGAQAQFYPSVNLVAFAGFSSIGLDRLLGAGSTQWGLGPALRLPLFDGGRLRANLRGKTADLDTAIESYNQTVIEAVREVADQLASQQAISRQQLEQRVAQVLAESAHAIALQRYEAGLGNYLQVLSAEASVLSQRRLGVDLAARALDTQVGLLHALGGGYRADSAAATAQAASDPNF